MFFFSHFWILSQKKWFIVLFICTCTVAESDNVCMWSALLSREFPFWPPLMRYRYSWMTTLWKPRQWEGLLSSSRLSRKWRNGRKNLCLCRTSWMNGSRYDSQEENDHTMIIYWAIINHESLIEYVSNVTWFFFSIYICTILQKKWNM